jgi:hypothetical protein
MSSHHVRGPAGDDVLFGTEAEAGLNSVPTTRILIGNTERHDAADDGVLRPY